jgi:AcrR family transcriptional regulator
MPDIAGDTVAVVRRVLVTIADAPVGSRRKQVENNGRAISIQDILHAAMEEFAARGYRGTNLIHVSDRLGVTRQALYYYFPRKQDMLQAIISRYFDGLESGVEEAAATIEEPEKRFVAMLEAHFSWVASNPTATSVVMHEELILPEAMGAPIQRRRIRQQNRFVEAYNDAVEAREFAPLPANLVVSTLIGAGSWAYRWFKTDGGLTPQQYAEFATQLLRDGFLVRSDL